MKNLKRTASVILLIFVFVLMISGCSQSQVTTPNATTATTTKTTNTTQTSGTTSTEKKELITVRLMTNEHVHSIMNMDIGTFKMLGESLNIDIEFETAPLAEYDNLVNMTLASKDFPHVMGAKTAIMSQYYDTGIVYQLDELIKQKVPNFIDRCNETNPAMLTNLKDDQGNLWYFCKIEQIKYVTNPYINGDWLEELDLAVPKTTDELYDVLKKFKTAKGENSIPWSRGPWYRLQNDVFNYFGSSRNWLHLKPGEYVFGPYERSEEFKRALAYLNKLYAENLIDKDFVVRDDDGIVSQITQNNVGYFITYSYGTTFHEGQSDGLNFLVTGPLSGGGSKPYVQRNNPISNPFFIMKSAESVLDRVLEMFNYLYSPEGAVLFSYGIEGETYTKTSDGKYQFTETILNHELGGINGRRQFGINPNPFPHVSLSMAWDQLVHPQSVKGLQETDPFFAESSPVLSSTVEESAELTQLLSELNKLIDESIPKFIVGELSVENDFDSFVTSMEQLGVKRYVEIIHEQYKRWQNRG